MCLSTSASVSMSLSLCMFLCMHDRVCLCQPLSTYICPCPSHIYSLHICLCLCLCLPLYISSYSSPVFLCPPVSFSLSASWVSKYASVLCSWLFCLKAKGWDRSRFNKQSQRLMSWWRRLSGNIAIRETRFWSMPSRLNGRTSDSQPIDRVY